MSNQVNHLCQPQTKLVYVSSISQNEHTLGFSNQNLKNKKSFTTFRVLLFPPVNKYYRFLIHQTCETYTKKYDLVTFSIGSLVRRTVLCYRTQLKDSSKLGSSYLNGAGAVTTSTTTSSDM